MCIGLWRVASGHGERHVETMKDLQLRPFPVDGRRSTTKKVYASLSILDSLLQFGVQRIRIGDISQLIRWYTR